jgi:DNA-binding IclR family transcriptional regulator
VPRPSPQTERVVAILAHLADHEEGATLTELARAVHADRSAFVHVLAALTTAGVLVRDPVDRRYRLGPALVRPGEVAAARYGDLALVRREMQALSASLGLPCLSFQPDHDHGRLAQYVWPEGGEPPAIPVGETLPLHPPLGILFVAWGSDDGFERWLTLDPDLPADRGARYREQREAIRSLGFVVEARPRTMEDEEFARLIDDRTSPRRDGKLMQLLADHGRDEHILTELGGAAGSLHPVHAIGSPCFDASGATACSLSVIGFTGPLRTDEIRRIGAEIRGAAERATAALGGRPPRPATARPRPMR